MNTLKTICIFDPAFDIVKAPKNLLHDFARTRDLKSLEGYYKQGQRPTVYTIRYIPSSVFRRHVLTGVSDEDKYIKAFQYGVIAIEGLYNDDGTRVNWEPSGQIDTPDGSIPCVSDAELERIDRCAWLEIGAVAWTYNFLPRTSKNGYVALPSSVEILLNQTFPSVDASPITVAPSSSKPLDPGPSPKESTGKSSEYIESKSAVVTAATAVDGTV
jgi:hypothetical protein